MIFRDNLAKIGVFSGNLGNIHFRTCANFEKKEQSDQIDVNGAYDSVVMLISDTLRHTELFVCVEAVEYLLQFGYEFVH